MLFVEANVSCCAYYTGEIFFEAKTEADSNDVTEHSHYDKPWPYVCTMYEKPFTQKRNLNDHKLIHSGVRLYSCAECGKCLSSQSNLINHKNIHTSRYECTECGKCCVTSRDLAVHRRSHSGEKPFECKVCSKRFTHSNGLVRHSRIHIGAKLYKFKQSGHLRRHVNSHMPAHTGEKPHHCPYCDAQFRTNTQLKTHVRIHTGAKPYSCRHCATSFTWDYQLKTHLLKSHNEGTWLTCHICQKKFSHGGSLKRHLLLHKDKDVKPYICSQCQKRFCTAAGLKGHQLVHTDFKQFCCGLCGKWFKSKYSIKSHFKRSSHTRISFLPGHKGDGEK